MPREKNIPTRSYGYLAATGFLPDPCDAVTALGVVKVDSGNLHNTIMHFRNDTHYYSPFLFRDVREQNVHYYKRYIDLFFSIPSSSFHCMIAQQNTATANPFIPPEIAHGFIAQHLTKGEQLALFGTQTALHAYAITDEALRPVIQKRARRDALFGIYPLELPESSELQMAQVLLGTVAYAYKLKLHLISAGKNAKYRLVKHLQKKLNTDALSIPHHYTLRFNRLFSIQEAKK